MKPIITLILTIGFFQGMAQSRDTNIAIHAPVYVIERCSGLRIHTKTWEDSVRAERQASPYRHNRRITGRVLSLMPLRDVNDALSLFVGVYQKKRGEGVCIDGGRPEGNLYVIDGMRILPW